MWNCDFLIIFLEKYNFQFSCGANHQKCKTSYCCVIIFEIKNPSAVYGDPAKPSTPKFLDVNVKNTSPTYQYLITVFCFILNSTSFFCNLTGVILEVPEERIYVKVHKFKIRGTPHKCYMHFHCGLCTHEAAISIDALRYVLTVFAIYTQLAFTCSKLTIEVLNKVWNMFKVNNKDTWTTPPASFWCLCC